MWIQRFWVRNGIALAGLLLAIYLPDHYAIQARSGWAKWTPYLFLLLMYGWIVFHNRILFERLFEQGKRREYVGWLLLSLVIGTVNMTVTLRYGYDIHWPVPILVKFYLFTITGLGVYVTYRQLTRPTDPPATPVPTGFPTSLPFTILTDDGKRELIPSVIVYIESLENYVRVVTTTTTFVTRLTMKQAEEQLTNSHFLRISRSHLVNIQHVSRYSGDELVLGKQTLRVGRTYKQHVAEQLNRKNTIVP
ncbi:LytTR family transcriptional regulator DNA-binding domain-containing protein [Spirosoma arcticum]